MERNLIENQIYIYIYISIDGEYEQLIDSSNIEINRLKYLVLFLVTRLN